MARPSKPFFIVAKDGWYSTVNGKRHRLAKGRENKAEALRAFHRLMADERPETVAMVDVTVELAADLFLDHCRREVAPRTYEQYRIKLQSFVAMFGKTKLTDLRPSHVSKWTTAKGWAPSTRRGAITYLKGMVSFAIRERMIRESPIRDVARPPATRKTKTLTADDRAAVATAGADKAWADLIIALTQTGARPGEIAALEARHVDWEAGVATLPGKTTSTTGKDRTIVLTGTMFALCRSLAETHPAGPLFRNAKDRAWTNNSMRCRFRRYRASKGLDPKIGANTFRHSFVTDGLERGASVTAMAALAGHTDLKMVSEVYNHLKERREHLREAAERAAGISPPGGSGSEGRIPDPGPAQETKPKPTTGKP